MNNQEKKIYFKKYYQKNKEKLKEDAKNYRILNQDKIIKYRQKNQEKARENYKKYTLKHKIRLSELDKIYRKNNKEKIKEKTKNYREKNKEKIKQSLKKYYALNKKKFNDYHKQKKQTNPLYKLQCRLRIRLNGALKKNWKRGSAVRDLGCTIEFLKEYLESLFQLGMTWDNWGNKEGQWSIDHIYPLSKVDLTNREELLKVCHYTNLQPLWHTDNIKKGNKII